jgi:hypothetical protein
MASQLRGRAMFEGKIGQRYLSQATVAPTWQV